MKQKTKTMVVDLLTVEHVGSVDVAERTVFEGSEVNTRKPNISVWSHRITHRFSAKELSEYISKIQEIVNLDFEKSYSGSRGFPSITYGAECDDFKISVYTHLDNMNTLNEVAGCEMIAKKSKYISTSFTCKVGQS